MKIKNLFKPENWSADASVATHDSHADDSHADDSHAKLRRDPHEAAKLRVASYENLRLGAGGLAGLLRRISESWSAPWYPVRVAVWREWQRSSAPFVLRDNTDRLLARGIRAEHIVADITGTPFNMLTPTS